MFTRKNPVHRFRIARAYAALGLVLSPLSTGALEQEGARANRSEFTHQDTERCRAGEGCTYEIWVASTTERALRCIVSAHARSALGKQPKQRLTQWQEIPAQAKRLVIVLQHIQTGSGGYAVSCYHLRERYAHAKKGARAAHE